MSGGFFDRNDNIVETGDYVIYELNGRKAILNEALQDGDAGITYMDGTHANVKWTNLTLIEVPTFPNDFSS